MDSRRDDLERLVNLTFAFLSAESYSRKYLTHAWIRTHVNGYGCLGDAAFRKKLSRDLAYLRRVGVPLEQVSGTEQAYRLRPDTYQLPEVQFTPAESAVLGLIGEMGQSQELDAFARSGWTKIAAGGAERELSRSPAVTNAGDLRTLSAHTLDAVLRARHRGRRIAFSYARSRALEPSTRTMDPWGLVPERDRIYLVGFDLDRGAPRCFRITRISDVQLIAPATHLPAEGTDLQEVVREQLRRGRQLIDAHLSITPGRAVALSSVGTDNGDGTWTLRDVERDWLVRTAAASAPDAVLLSPSDAVADVLGLLKRAAGAEE
ncbi:helix-turn-helix transcriptional regulator [Corynebacterium pacaense]|uniref:helix-turn-helix transcriptional regulator n=1 Tax=Corynebacterium pacaense TaxID=1816684 RepID=UPI0009BB0B02|nr:WYL domain-containing protein [Corynebacterium pacaense]